MSADDQPPYAVDLVAVAEGFTCMATGRPGGAVALRLRSRTDPDAPPILLDPCAVVAIITAELALLERAVDHVDP